MNKELRETKQLLRFPTRGICGSCKEMVNERKEIPIKTKVYKFCSECIENLKWTQAILRLKKKG